MENRLMLFLVCIGAVLTFSGGGFAKGGIEELDLLEKAGE